VDEWWFFPEIPMQPTEILSTLMHEFPYALFGSIIVGILCSFIGVYIVAKRVVFLGAVLTQVSVLGLTATFLPLFALPHTLGSLGVTLVTVLVLSRLLTGRKVPRDAVLGVVFASSIAVRILLMQKAPRVEVAEVESLLRGDILFVTPELFFLMAGAFVVVMATYLLFFKEFNYVIFDPDTAATQGYRPVLWETLFYVLAGAAISFATHMVGDLLVFGFLVLPPVSAMLITRTVTGIFTTSMLIGAVAPVVGLFLAFYFDFPSSPAIVAVAFLVLAISWVQSVVRIR
jgi:ABC-type Mn2+/Zn2+ transport system permease subunit